MEGRAYPRHAIRVRVRITPATLGLLYTANLSRGGVAVDTPRPVRTETLVGVTLDLPGYSVDLSATVRHCAPHPRGRGFRVGLQFVDITDEQRASIERILVDADVAAK